MVDIGVDYKTGGHISHTFQMKGTKQLFPHKFVVLYVTKCL